MQRTRMWAWAGVAAQVVFVVAWLVAPRWQGRRYSALDHTISDMYAVGAPGGVFLVVVLTLCGLATILFALLAVRPGLRSGGRAPTVGAVLLALSIFGVGDLLSPFEREGCRLADPGCTGADQMANAGGKLDSIISTAGIFLFLAAVFVLAAAMRRADGWRTWVRPGRWVGIGFAVLLVATATGRPSRRGGDPTVGPALRQGRASRRGGPTVRPAIKYHIGRSRRFPTAPNSIRTVTSGMRIGLSFDASPLLACRARPGRRARKRGSERLFRPLRAA